MPSLTGCAASYPASPLESCAGGGGRLDLGMLSRFHYGCESDMSAFPRSIRAINGLTLFLPPEALCYYHNHLPHAHQLTDLHTHLRVALFARTIFVGFGAQDADRDSEYFQPHPPLYRAGEKLRLPAACRASARLSPYAGHRQPGSGELVRAGIRRARSHRRLRRPLPPGRRTRATNTSSNPAASTPRAATR